MTIQQHGAPGTPPTENPPSSDDSASAEDTAPIPSIPSVPASLEVTPLGRSVIYRAIHSEAEWTPWARRLRADATMAQLYNATTDALYSSDPYTPDRRGLLRAAAQVLCYLQSAAATTLTGTALVGVPQTIYEACDAERARQIAQWGGAEHDREHGPGTWMRMLQKQFVQAESAAAEYAAGERTTDERNRQLVQVLALLVARLELLLPWEGPISA